MPPKNEAATRRERTVDVFMDSLGSYPQRNTTPHDMRNTGRVVWRRLNRVEYENSVHDLLAIDTPLAEMLPEDGSARGFDTVSEGLRLSASQIEAYLQAADAA